MDIGPEKPAIEVEPLEDPFRITKPLETPEKAPAKPVETPVPEKVPA